LVPEGGVASGRFTIRTLLGEVFLLDEVELLDVLGATGEISWVLSSTVGTFWGELVGLG
jgi:hypothetical protein